ncbi:MAG: PHP domain-containing protein [Dehalococcoidia bacterium]|nr:PHP domain-containing protein [Dehalococcoidia bacterium]
MIAADLHLHTCYSYDCATRLTDVADRSRKAGLDCVAVTDHNTIAGALRLRDSGTIRVIVGEEISTTHGEMIGLFLSELVPRGLPPGETIERIKGQGGLVCIPHPLGRRPFPANSAVGTVRDGRFSPSARITRANALLTEDVIARVDLLEAINSRTPFPSTWRAVSRLVALCGLPLTAGSDAHTAREIGRARVLMEDFADAPGFMAAIHTAKVSGVRSSPLIHVASMCAKLRRRACSD